MRHYAFRVETVDVPLRAGTNVVVIKLSNGSNDGLGTLDPVVLPGSKNGGWAFSFLATAADGTLLAPQAP